MGLRNAVAPARQARSIPQAATPPSVRVMKTHAPPSTQVVAYSPPPRASRSGTHSYRPRASISARPRAVRKGRTAG